MWPRFGCHKIKIELERKWRRLGDESTMVVAGWNLISHRIDLSTDKGSGLHRGQYEEARVIFQCAALSLCLLPSLPACFSLPASLELKTSRFVLMLILSMVLFPPASLPVPPFPQRVAAPHTMLCSPLPSLLCPLYHLCALPALFSALMRVMPLDRARCRRSWLRCRYERTSRSFLTNIFLPMWSTVCFSFSSFAVPITSIADRLSVTLTMVLTVMALKFVVRPA